MTAEAVAVRVPRAREEPAPEPRRPRPRLTVAPPPPVAAPRAPFVVLVLLVVIGGLLGILLLNTKTNESAFDLYELRQQQALLDQRQQELEQEIAQRRSSAQLSAAAHRLGLERMPAGELAQVRLPSGELVGEPAPVPGEPPAGDPDGGGEG